MKNILITTTYDVDTFNALKIAADLIRHHKGSVVLLTVSDLSDSITELLFLSARDHVDQEQRQKRLEEWRHFKIQNDVSFDSLDIKEHHQFGFSRPILRQILERFEIDMIIVPHSMQRSRFCIHKVLLKLLNDSQYTLLLLSAEQPSSERIQRALFLDGSGELLTAEIENMPFHIIHKSMLDQSTWQHQSLKQLIDRHKIDLIVQRKKNRAMARINADLPDLGLPVLTV